MEAVRGLVVAKCEFLRLDGCNSQLSPGWLLRAQPFLDSLFSHIWNWAVHLALREPAVRDAQFVVETLRLSWHPCVMGAGGPGPGSEQSTSQPLCP